MRYINLHLTLTLTLALTDLAGHTPSAPALQASTVARKDIAYARKFFVVVVAGRQIK